MMPWGIEHRSPIASARVSATGLPISIVHIVSPIPTERIHADVDDNRVHKFDNQRSRRRSHLGLKGMELVKTFVDGEVNYLTGRYVRRKLILNGLQQIISPEPHYAIRTEYAPGGWSLGASFPVEASVIGSVDFRQSLNYKWMPTASIRITTYASDPGDCVEVLPPRVFAVTVIDPHPLPIVVTIRLLTMRI